MDQSFKLDDKEHERKYKEIESDLFRNTSTASHPRAVIMGGQPGSGKSKLLEASRELFPDGNVVVINGDDLREYHPKSEEIFNNLKQRERHGSAPSRTLGFYALTTRIRGL